MDRLLQVSEKAAQRIVALAKKQENQKPLLRVLVQSGGCFGFQYSFALESTINDEDHLFEHQGASVVVDSLSLDLLKGATLDYAEDMMSATFVIINPSASGSCGCGSSFSL